MKRGKAFRFTYLALVVSVYSAILSAVLGADEALVSLLFGLAIGIDVSMLILLIAGDEPNKRRYKV